MESTTEFVERIKKIHEEVGAALRKMQEKMKRYTDRSRRETGGDRKQFLQRKNLKRGVISSSQTVDLVSFYFIFYFHFIFIFFSYFSIFRT